MIKKGVKLTGVNKQGQTIMSYIMQFRAPSPGRIGFPGKIYSASEMQDYNRREQRVVDLLTAAGLDFKGKEGTETPLMSALEGQHFGDARALIDHGADVSIKDKDGNTALEYIFNWGQGALPLDILETILKRGGDPNTNFHIEGMQPPMVVPLLEEVIGIAANKYVDASSFRDAVKMLLDHGAKFPGTTDDKVQVLLQAAARGNLTAIQDAIRLGTSINAADGNGWNALTISTALGYDDAASWLIANGADIEGHTRPPGNFSTPLGFAVERGQADLVEKLLAKGAKPNDGIVGIVFAIRQNNQRIFDDLIKAGADPRNEATCTVTTGGVSYTPPDSKSIFLCIRNGNPAMAKTLLDKGENPNPANLQDNRGFVYWAIYYNQAEILKALLDHGANPSLKDAHGETPLALAQKSHPEMVSVLEEATNRTQAPK
jgi:ankyrin repeat protein